MYNYYLGTVLVVDVILLAATLLLTITILCFVIIKSHNDKFRNYGLLKIKQDLYKLFVSGEENAALHQMAAKSTIEQFIDIAANRRRDAVFFNQAEQAAFRKYFVKKNILKTLEKRASNPWNKWRRIEAIIALGFSQDESAISVLQKSLKDRDLDVSYF
jgi:hypothetical protein